MSSGSVDLAASDETAFVGEYVKAANAESRLRDGKKIAQRSWSLWEN
jgi:hypothetical protein